MTLKSFALFLLTATACSSAPSPVTTPDVAPFLGTWTYQAGSSIVADCPGMPPQSIDLAKVPPANQPGYFTFAEASAESLHEVDARGCQYAWTVSGDAATAAPGQSCTTFPDGRGGSRLVALQSGTKRTPDGASMTIDVAFTSAAPESCAITVKGVATKS